MKIRLTCTELAAIVSGSNFYVTARFQHKRGLLFIQQFGKNNWKYNDIPDSFHTHVEGMLTARGFVKNRRWIIPKGRSTRFIHLMNSLFRCAHFREIQIMNFNYREDLPEGRMDANQLLQLSDSLTCQTLSLSVFPYEYSPRLFDIIHKLNPSTQLNLTFSNMELDDPIELVDNDHILNLPSVPTLKISSHPFVFKISGEDLLLLVSKHSCFILDNWAHLRAETFAKAAELISKSGHVLELQYHYSGNMHNDYPGFIEYLRLMGIRYDPVSYDEHGIIIHERITRADPSVRVVSGSDKRYRSRFQYTVISSRTNAIVRFFATYDDATVRIEMSELTSVPIDNCEDNDDSTLLPSFLFEDNS
ncbi:hypothetical protein PMAYCL1PPCAC_32009 [Pristionchus mayeri]|uniref:Uncharacterized protein n=1 Tax=Pristionchus mayeri TaxID=1317129 RepID=A0AAN5IEN1_9BILA|nr:hypothetical protein PMAYCL1PPCAC_32009 [Pristionchus mayeri]